MRKTEFMDLLKYYFRRSDKTDLKGILEDCEEQFRLGAKKGLTEEEVCAKLGHPKNIYRYYIGKPIVPEDNLSMTGSADAPAQEAPEAAPAKPSQFYDWEKDPAHRRRPKIREAYYPMPQPEPPRNYDAYAEGPQRPKAKGPTERTADEDELQWNDKAAIPQAAKAIASPFLDIFGALFNIISTILFFAFALALLASIAVYSLPPYIFSDLLPLPTLSVSTMAFAVLALLFAALTASYASQACHRTVRNARNPQRRNG